MLIPTASRAWQYLSVKLALLTAALAVLEPALPSLGLVLPERWYGYAALTIALSRIIAQPSLHTDPPPPMSTPPDPENAPR